MTPEERDRAEALLKEITPPHPGDKPVPESTGVRMPQVFDHKAGLILLAVFTLPLIIHWLR